MVSWWVATFPQKSGPRGGGGAGLCAELWAFAQAHRVWVVPVGSEPSQTEAVGVVWSEAPSGAP